MLSGVPKWAWNAKLSSHSHNLSQLHPAKTRLKHDTVDKIIVICTLWHTEISLKREALIKFEIPAASTSLLGSIHSVNHARFWSLKSHDLQTLQSVSQSVSQLFNIMIKCNKTRCRRQNHCFLNAFWRAEVGLKREALITFSQFIPAAPCQNTPETRYCRQNHCYLHALAYRNQPETRSSHQIRDSCSLNFSARFNPLS